MFSIYCMNSTPESTGNTATCPNRSMNTIIMRYERYLTVVVVVVVATAAAAAVVVVVVVVVVVAAIVVIVVIVVICREKIRSEHSRIHDAFQLSDGPSHAEQTTSTISIAK